MIARSPHGCCCDMRPQEAGAIKLELFFRNQQKKPQLIIYWNKTSIFIRSLHAPTIKQ